MRMVSDRANSWETRAKEAEGKLAEAEQRATTADTLAARVTELEGKLGQAEGAHARYRAASQAGISDSDTIDLLEYSHGKAMQGKAKKDQVAFGPWLEGIKADPNTAPAPLRHLFTQGQGQQGQGQQQQQGQQNQQGQGYTPTGQGQQQPPPASGQLSPQDIARASSMEQWQALYSQWQSQQG